MCNITEKTSKKDTTSNIVTPFIHWMGGKSRLLRLLRQKLPTGFNNYYEPFIGGGALLFDLDPKNAYISDMNEELILTYQVIQKSAEKLILDLNKHIMSADYYYAIRNIDRDKEEFSKLTNVERASRFIYLTKAAFNGLYRVNKKGQHNASFGTQDNFNFNADSLRETSRRLKNYYIKHQDFNSIKNKVSKGDFVYFDPPYLDSDQNYTKEGFTLADHIKLKELCDYIDSVGAYFMLSNSYNEDTINLFYEYNIDYIGMRQNINPDSNRRAEIREILVTNYTNYRVANNKADLAEKQIGNAT